MSRRGQLFCSPGFQPWLQINTAGVNTSVQQSLPFSSHFAAADTSGKAQISTEVGRCSQCPCFARVLGWSRCAGRGESLVCWPMHKALTAARSQLSAALAQLGFSGPSQRQCWVGTCPSVYSLGSQRDPWGGGLSELIASKQRACGGQPHGRSPVPRAAVVRRRQEPRAVWLCSRSLHKV